MTTSTPLPPEELFFDITPTEIKDLEEEIPAGGIIGQPRALRALEMGIGIRSKGYNIFVSGISGTGRTTSVKRILSDYSPSDPQLLDILYVYNFMDSDYPEALYLPKGEGHLFKERVHDLVENMKELVKAALESESYKKERDRLISIVEQEENHSLAEFEAELAKEGFQIVHVREDEEQTSDIAPLYNGEATTFEHLQELTAQGEFSEKRWNELRERYYELMDRMSRLFKELKEARGALEKELEGLKEEMVRPGVEEAVDAVAALYTEEKIRSYLDRLKKDILEHLFLFIKEQPKDPQGNPALIRYGVNVLVDNRHTQTVPIIFENHPTYTNLFGTIESRMDIHGQSRTNFMMIKAGSLIRASGGFLVLDAQDLLKEEGLWELLKRALKNGQVEIQPSEQVVSLQHTLIKPRPIRMDTKVIVIGTENLYDVLYERDYDFHKHFKISAEFDSVMPRDRHNTAKYLGFIKMIREEEGLLPFKVDGTAGIIRHGVFLAEQRDKLSTRFSQVADLLREANYWAVKTGKNEVDGEAVEAALEERKYLAGLPEEKILEMVMGDEIVIDVAETKTGIVNGLAVHDRGYYSFGSPVVVSARCAPGNDGIINIEREVGLSGEIHDKWMLILEGYLRNKYADTFPLSVYASICFEQSYGEIEGDSASAAEVYALLSAIGGFSVHQNLAVTGSINQTGDILPVGGISEKVDGFFTVCEKVGLTGTQGVIIPERNKPNLMLSRKTVEAVEEGTFFVYPISTIDQGLELLTDRNAGERTARGEFPKNSINALIEFRLKEMANQVKNYSS
ncbi:MAG: Lon protease family protein [Spirochaetaceae bacterium]